MIRWIACHGCPCLSKAGILTQLRKAGAASKAQDGDG
jgi:hypothetical protein